MSIEIRLGWISPSTSLPSLGWLFGYTWDWERDPGHYWTWNTGLRLMGFDARIEVEWSE